MPKVTIAEFASMAGISAKNVHTYAGKDRKKVIIGADKLVDTFNEVNALFLSKRSAKAAVSKAKAASVPETGKRTKKQAIPTKKSATPASPANTPTKTARKPTNQPASAENDPIAAATADLMRLETLKIEIAEREVTKRDIDIAKKRGELVPVEPMKALFLQHSKSLTNAFRQAGDRIIDIFTVKLKMSAADAAEMRKTLVEATNKAIVTANDETKKGIVKIAAEYAEKRGVGERGAA